ncbi:hypothetical protein K1X76_03780 [bacterium]|nr:hypothetical protein [bacterium]
MTSNISSATANLSAININSSSFSGVDSLIYIQLLLVQDYDAQLKSMGKEIKNITTLKGAYRKDIEQLQSLLGRENVGDKDNPKVKVSGDEYNFLVNKNPDYRINSEGKLTDDYRHLTKDKSDDLQKDKLMEKSAKSDIKYVQIKDKKTGKMKNSSTIESCSVLKKDIETKIETLKQKMEGLNEQSEISSLSLQSITSQRKIALDSVSNLINKQDEGLSNIVRNIKG